MKTTDYFRAGVMARRPYLKMEWIDYVLRNPIRTEVQPNGRIRYWAFISEAGKYLRVVTGQTERRCIMPSSIVVLSLERRRSDGF